MSHHALAEPYRGCTHVQERNEYRLMLSGGSITGIFTMFIYGTEDADGAFVQDPDGLGGNRALTGREFTEGFLPTHGATVTLADFQATLRSWFDTWGWADGSAWEEANPAPEPAPEPEPQPEV